MAFEYAVFGLSVGLFSLFVFFWTLHPLAFFYGKYKFHRKSKESETRKECHHSQQGVTIIKPLMGVDDNLQHNLESFFTMDYPCFELLFCVNDNNDPAIMVVKQLLDKYPQVDAKLFSGGKNVGINPKINNMMPAYEVAKYELIFISDAGIWTKADTLSEMIGLLTDKVGLVHQMPYTCDRPGFAGTLEKVYFGTSHSRLYLAINLVGQNCVTGMSCLMRKSVLDKVGGLATFGNYIAEDFFIAQTYLDQKWTIQLAHQPALQNSATYSVTSWQKRMIRWCKLRLKLTPISYLEPFQDCFLAGTLGSYCVNALFGWNSLVFFLIHVLCWFLSDYLMLRLVQNGQLPFKKFDYVVSWLYRETICLYLFVKAASNPTVKWRNGQYKLLWWGLAQEIKSDSDSPAVVSNSSSKEPIIKTTTSTADEVKETTVVSASLTEASSALLSSSTASSSSSPSSDSPADQSVSSSSEAAAENATLTNRQTTTDQSQQQKAIATIDNNNSTIENETVSSSSSSSSSANSSSVDSSNNESSSNSSNSLKNSQSSVFLSSHHHHNSNSSIRYVQHQQLEQQQQHINSSSRTHKRTGSYNNNIMYNQQYNNNNNNSNSFTNNHHQLHYANNNNGNSNNNSAYSLYTASSGISNSTTSGSQGSFLTLSNSNTTTTPGSKNSNNNINNKYNNKNNGNNSNSSNFNNNNNSKSKHQHHQPHHSISSPFYSPMSSATSFHQKHPNHHHNQQQHQKLLSSDNKRDSNGNAADAIEMSSKNIIVTDDNNAEQQHLNLNKSDEEETTTTTTNESSDDSSSHNNNYQFNKNKSATSIINNHTSKFSSNNNNNKSTYKDHQHYHKNVASTKYL